MDPTEERLRAAYIEGDETVLPILADWYEDQDSPMVLAIRDWCKLQREIREVFPLLPNIQKVENPQGMLYSLRQRLDDVLIARHIPLCWDEFKEPTVFALMQQGDAEAIYGRVLRVCELRNLDWLCGREHSSEEMRPYRGNVLAEAEQAFRNWEIKNRLEGDNLRKKIKADALAAAHALLVGNGHQVEQYLVGHANTNPYPGIDENQQRGELRMYRARYWVQQLDRFLANNNHIRGHYGTPQEG